ncbi:MAG TPA: hypothetical protein VLV89_02185 [Candidatus Acidoferrum sp.]|nr:hypothetical protein [Candidatus Acidoferrum sp.]
MVIRGDKLFFSISLCAALAFVLSGCGKSEKTQGTASGTTETRVSVKTGLPPGADPNQPRVLTFAEFASIPEPPGVTKNDPRYEKQRIPAFPNPLGVKEGDVVKVRGYLQVVTLMGDGDYNFHFTATASSPDRYAVVEIPDDDDVADKKLRPLVESARDALKRQALSGKDPARTPGSTISPALYVEITGQLFFSDNHVGDQPNPDRQGFYRATNWQIHPGLMISFPAPPAAPPAR